MSPARDASITDREATQRIVKARGVDPTSATVADMHFKFHVYLAVRSHRRCQDPAYRRFVLRMRMKAMYAFIASSKSSGLSAATSPACCMCYLYAVILPATVVVAIPYCARPELVMPFDG